MGPTAYSTYYEFYVPKKITQKRVVRVFASIAWSFALKSWFFEVSGAPMYEKQLGILPKLMGSTLIFERP